MVIMVKAITLSAHMKTMTAKDAKTRFGEMLDTMQREPVMLTKNNRPVGFVISIQDAADTLIPEMFMEKEAGYDDWFAGKVNQSLSSLKTGAATLTEHETAMDRVWERLQTRAKKPVSI
jgi:prevent-host-death family protein